MVTPLKINMEPKKRKFGSDDFPFQTADFQFPAQNFPGCIGKEDFPRSSTTVAFYISVTNFSASFAHAK